MTKKNGEHVEALFRRWLNSHGCAEAVGFWKAATGIKVGEYAFTAIASDRSVLSKMPMNAAEKLARDAEDYVKTLRSVFDGTSPGESPASAAMHVVSQAVLAWRRRRTSTAISGDGLQMARPDFECSAPNGETWEEALKTYPQFSEATGAMTLAAVVALGARGLANMQKPWDRVGALGAARYAARASRGDLVRPAPSLVHVLSGISAIQEYAITTGRSPWDVAYARRGGSPATQALRLARDAAACCDIAAGLPGGPDAQGFPIWVEGEERHAFASMSLDRSLVMGMVFDEALRFASSALRRADKLAALPDGPAILEAEGLPPDSLKMVAVVARAVVPNGPRPRPWEGKAGNSTGGTVGQPKVW